MTTATDRLRQLPSLHANGQRAGITSVCSAHPLVIEAALLHGIARDADVLVEATCNQVNQDGGYTGMTPIDFRRFVEAIAGRVAFPLERLILGGDHLGPNPWKDRPADEAMAKAEVMIAAYAAAGFTKIHLDTSMGCAGEPVALDDRTTAERAARLAAVCEAHVEGTKPVYVIGTEVPVPGGALEELDHLELTTPEAALATIDVHRSAFSARGLDDAFSRAIAAVVQPGVEFGNADVVVYRPVAAQALWAALAEMPGFVFEAHSTDYQPREALKALVDDGFSILKVGPGLTFALREALYGLDAIAAILVPDGRRRRLPDAMEAVMLASPGSWQKYYPGAPEQQAIERHYSFSDRIRYYWPEPGAARAVDELMAALGSRAIPQTLVSQYLGRLYDKVASGRVEPTARSLLIASVANVLDDYAYATDQG
ncbi:D-tagatose-bisphosphate aldolase, class II, non-catalytic subunit [Mangrovicella endophytica]|uniref:D-tagatose-bisphosphate aldolase, class II, non-catalytic subunit n=1 Tax=Mangrovicella endophytica TaxID=2066697 RepID=UPI000C9DD713|nr:D-tagatose-bisphosphate aldolase, class II, non-catalytic subunit [Mangrovicella endophytica]